MFRVLQDKLKELLQCKFGVVEVSYENPLTKSKRMLSFSVSPTLQTLQNNQRVCTSAI